MEEYTAALRSLKVKIVKQIWHVESYLAIQ